MTPAAIIKEALADGVNLALSPTGTIKATGEGAAVSRWLPVIREHKAKIMAALQEAANDLLPDPAMEDRRQRVLAILAENPNIRRAVLVDNADADPVLLSVAIRDMATCELAIPAAKFDAFLLIELIGRHGAETVH